MEILIIPYMALMAALSGASIWPAKYIPGFLSWLPEALFAAGIALVWYLTLGPIWAVPVLAWSYIWMQTGHANALSWGLGANPDRTNTLTPVVDWVASRFGIDSFGRAYSAVFFAIKGFLLSLPIGGLGVFVWPLAYDIGTWLQVKGLPNKYSHAISELLSGFFVGILVYVALEVVGV